MRNIVGKRKRFWEGFAIFREGRSLPYHFEKPSDEGWCNVTGCGLSTSKAHIALQVTPAHREMACQFYIFDDKDLFARILAQKDRVEQILGFKLVSYNSQDSKCSYFEITHEFEIDDERKWKECYQWFLNQIDAFGKAFTNFYGQENPSAINPAPSPIIENLPVRVETGERQRVFSERDFEDIICKYSELIEDELTFKGRQLTLYGRRMDVLFEDKFKRKLIIELKKGPIKDEHIGQILSYEGMLLSAEDPSIRVMLVGNRVPPNIQRSLDHHGIAWKELNISFLKEFLKSKSDEAFPAISSDGYSVTEKTAKLMHRGPESSQNGNDSVKQQTSSIQNGQLSASDTGFLSSDQDKYWNAARMLIGKTLFTKKMEVPFTVVEVGQNLKYQVRSGKICSYSRQKVESFCRHRQNGGEITIPSLYQSGIERKPDKDEYNYIPTIIDEILWIINHGRRSA